MGPHFPSPLSLRLSLHPSCYTLTWCGASVDVCTVTVESDATPGGSMAKPGPATGAAREVVAAAPEVDRVEGWWGGRAGGGDAAAGRAWGVVGASRRMGRVVVGIL